MKVAITSQYYKSKNYGGNLQSYALCKVIEQCGCKTEQLCFPIKLSRLTPLQEVNKKRIAEKLKITVKVFIYNLLIFNRHLKSNRMIKQREKSFLDFNLKMIPHSRKVYSENDIIQSVREYDLFVTGSDLVWNPNAYSPIFTLEFVPENIPKFSYAPSMGITSLTELEQIKYREFLKFYQAVSVRESNSVELLKELSPRPVEWVLDPTLLLNEEDWNKICSKRKVQEAYVFCYFLGSNKNSRETAEKYAKKHHLKVVTIPYLLGSYRECDYRFGDVRLSDVSPEDFISLIRYADCVFTDSFHACVFSYLYKREFFAFRRDSWDKIGSRINSFLELLGYQQRYCDTDEKEKMSYIEGLSKINYSVPFKAFEEMKKSSIDYLVRNLKKQRRK